MLLVSLRDGALELLLLLVQRGAVVDIACVCSLLLSLLHELLLHPLLLQPLQTVSVLHRLLPLFFVSSLVRLHVYTRNGGYGIVRGGDQSLYTY